MHVRELKELEESSHQNRWLTELENECQQLEIVLCIALLMMRAHSSNGMHCKIKGIFLNRKKSNSMPI